MYEKQVSEHFFHRSPASLEWMNVDFFLNTCTGDSMAFSETPSGSIWPLSLRDFNLEIIGEHRTESVIAVMPVLRCSSFQLSLNRIANLPWGEVGWKSINAWTRPTLLYPKYWWWSFEWYSKNCRGVVSAGTATHEPAPVTIWLYNSNCLGHPWLMP